VPAPNPNDDPALYLIRANQGHSIALASSSHLVPLTVEANNIPETVVHGTYFAFWEEIERSGGLKKMGRNHVHFGTAVPGTGDKEVVSGMRGDAELLVYVDVERSVRDGALDWWLSENGVVLTEGDGDGMVGTKWFKKVVGRRDDVGVLWEEGEKKVDLPESCKGRKPPMGKGRGRRDGGQRGRGTGGGKRGAGGGGRGRGGGTSGDCS